MSLYVTGDIHADVESRFGYRRRPGVRQFTSNDIVVILGDWGIPWDHTTAAEDCYKAKFIDSKPWTTIALRGNHDNTNLMREMPQEEKFGGKVRRLAVANDKGETYICNHVFIVDEPTILTLEGERCLCIPGADSHDMGLDTTNPRGKAIIDKSDPRWRMFRNKYRHWSTLYRVLNESWWEDEAIDIEKCAALLENENSNFDFIFTHDFPAIINEHYKRPGDPARMKSTEGELYLEELRKTLNFDCWFHGHLHTNLQQLCPDDRIMGLYHSILQIKE